MPHALAVQALGISVSGRARVEEALRRGAALPQSARGRVDEQGGGGQEGALVRFLPVPRRPRDATLSFVQARAPLLRPLLALLAVLPGGVAKLLELSREQVAGPLQRSQHPAIQTRSRSGPPRTPAARCRQEGDAL